MSEFIRRFFKEEIAQARRYAYQKSYDEGVRIGIRETQTKIVCNMLDMEFPHDMIAKATGIDISEVEALAAEH